MSEGDVDDEVVNEVDDDNQTGVYDNIVNVQQQLTRQRGGRARRDQYVNHTDLAASGTSSPAVKNGAETTATLNSMLSADWTSSVRRRGRCADRLTSNRIIGPSFVSSARVQLAVNGGASEPKQQQLPETQHPERSLSVGDEVELSSTATSVPELNNVDATSTTNTTDTETDPPWNGYDNVAELKEAIGLSTVARLAAGCKTKTGAAAAAAVSCGGTSVRDEGPCSDKVRLSSSSRVIGERVVDVHRQRLSASGRQVDDDVQMATSTKTQAVNESSVATVSSTLDTSGDTDAAAPTSTVDAVQTQNHPGAALYDADSSHAAHSDYSATNDTTLQQQETVCFEKQDADSGETKLVADKGRRQHRSKDKPPAGRTGNDSSKKSGKKSKEKKEPKSAAGGSEQQDQLIGKTGQQPFSKISFLRSLLTRSRSPSPKRGSSNSTDATSSTLSLSRDVAKRLSDPLKSSFKQTPDAPVVQVSVKQRDKKKKKPSTEDKKRSEQTSDAKDNSNCNGVLITNSSAERKTLIPLPAEEVKSSTMVSPDDGRVTSPLSKAENQPAATNNTSCTEQHTEIANMSPGSSVACQTTETASVVVTTASQLPTSGTAGFVSSTAGVVEQSPKRRRSATVITLRSASGGSSNEATTSHTGSTMSSHEISNPWLVNLSEFRAIRPNLERFEGEKVFRKGTATTRLVLPGFASRSQQDFLSSCHGEPTRSETLQRLTSTSRKFPTEPQLERHSAVTSTPIYDVVYVENPALICKSTTELLGDRHQSSIVQRAEDMGKSYSLQDIKQRNGVPQTSTVFGDVATAGRLRTLTMTEHAIDDDESRIGSRGQDDIGVVTPTTPSKLVKTVTFKDDVDENCPPVDHCLKSAQSLNCKTNSSINGKASKDFFGAVPAGAALHLAAGSTGAPAAGIHS